MTVFDVESYWDGRPCNIKHSNKQIGTSEFFVEVSLRKYFVEHHIKDFAKFHEWNGSKVLEIGCGIGTAMQSFAENEAFYTGVDLSSESIKIAQKRAEIFGLKNVELIVANAERLTDFLEVRPYDLIYSFGVLHHTPNIKIALKEIKRFSKPGTTIKLMLYSRFSTKSLSLWLRYGWRVGFSLDKAVALQSEAQFGCPITRTFSRSHAHKVAKEAGFRVTKMYKQHIFPFAIKPYVNYEYKFKWYWKILPKACFRKLESFFGWHLLIEGVYE
jgi:ubiquinone/menaquinone biosynthesis C-methylase UbiE